MKAWNTIATIDPAGLSLDTQKSQEKGKEIGDCPFLLRAHATLNPGARRLKIVANSAAQFIQAFSPRGLLDRGWLAPAE